MPDVNYELTPDMEEFFRTGELPAALQPQVDPPEDPPPQDPPQQTQVDPPQDPTKSEPQTPPEPNRYLEQLLEQERAQARQQTAEFEKQMKQLQDQLKELTAPKAPSVDEDPLGHILHQFKDLGAAIKALQEQQSQRDTQSQQMTAQQQFQQAVGKAVEDFQKDHPDYQQAYKHLNDARAADLASAGYTQQEIRQMLNQEEFNLCLRAMQSGKNPAEIAYGMAKRMGYQAPPPKQDPVSKVEQIKKGLEAAKGVPDGKQPITDVNLETLQGASDADLNKIVENGWEKLFGRPDRGSIF